MKPITIKNEHGETIEIKWDSDGTVRIRHSDIELKHWGELREYAPRLKQPGVHAKVKEIAARRGVDLDSPEAKELAGRMGGYILVGGKMYMISSQEVTLIHEAVRQAGGIIPNWSNCP